MILIRSNILSGSVTVPTGRACPRRTSSHHLLLRGYVCTCAHGRLLRSARLESVVQRSDDACFDTLVIQRGLGLPSVLCTGGRLARLAEQSEETRPGLQLPHGQSRRPTPLGARGCRGVASGGWSG